MRIYALKDRDTGELVWNGKNSIYAYPNEDEALKDYDPEFDEIIILELAEPSK